MSTRRAAAVSVGVVLIAALLSGCAGGGPGQGASDPGAATETPGPLSTTPPGAQVTPSQDPGSLPRGVPPTSSDKITGETTLTGDVVFVEIEGGCLTLRVNNKAYELLGGDRNMLTNGARVTVRGRVRTDIATTCQIGPVIEVLEVRRA